MKPLYHYYRPVLLALLLAPTLVRAQKPAPAHLPMEERSLEFIENKGQWEAPVRYEAALPNGRMFVEAAGFRYVFADNLSHPGHGAASPKAGQGPHRHALRLRFVAAATTPALTAERPTEELRNYFIGNDEKRWARGVRSYRQLRYADLWPGVGARVYENSRQQLEYDFELAPGADPARVRLRYEGADALALRPDGSLEVKTTVGLLRELAPQAYQTDPVSGQRQPVPCRFRLQGEELSFALGHYDHSRPLVIDPTVVFSSYTGSSADNWGFTATYDAQGNLYSGGITFDVGFPTTLGAYGPDFVGGNFDITLIKYRPGVNGAMARAWASYLGGNGSEFPHSLVVNNAGELLLLGSTSSLDYPTTTGAVRRTFAGGTFIEPFAFGFGFSGTYDLPNGSDMVVTRFNTAGSLLLASTYLGGSGNDGLLPLAARDTLTSQLVQNYGDAFRGDIEVDAADNVFIASHTSSLNFPVPGGYATSYRGGSTDAVVVKLNPGLTSVLWGTFLGGSGADAAYYLHLNAAGDVYVAGGSTSSNFPTTAGTVVPNNPGGTNGFVARLASAGNQLLSSTYLGTSASDQAYFLQIGTDGGVYVLGQSRGAYPVTAGRYANPGSHQFIHKLSPDLSQTLFSTVFGSGRSWVDITPTAFLVDRCDRIYVCGWGGSLNSASPAGGLTPYIRKSGGTFGLPVTVAAVQPTTDGNDFYLAQFSAGATALDYATFFGDPNSPPGEGDHVDGGTSRFDARGIVYEAVCSCGSSSGFPIPPGANTFSAFNNTFFRCNNAAFVLDFLPPIARAGLAQSVCATGQPLPLTGGTPAGGVWSGPGVSGSVATGFVFTPSIALVGVQTLTYTVVNTGLCTTTDNLTVTVTAPPTVTLAALPQTAYCLQSGQPVPAPVTLSGTPAGGTFSGPGVTGNQFSPTAAGVGTHTITYSFASGPNGTCGSQATRTVQVLSATAGPDLGRCTTDGPLPLIGTPTGGTWSGPGVSGTVAAGFSFNPATAGAGTHTLTYSLTATDGSCTATSTRRAIVADPAAVALAPLSQTAYCLQSGQPAPAPLTLSGTPAGGTFSGPGVTGNQFSPTAAGIGTHTITYTYTANIMTIPGGPPVATCTGQATRTVQVLSTTAGRDTTLCRSTAPLPLRSGQPAGGTWSGPGVSGSVATGFSFNPAAAGAGIHTLTYSLSAADGSCTASSTRRATVAELVVPSLTPLPTLCTNGAPVALGATPAGGSWRGPGVAGSAATGFSFNPLAVGVGQYVLTYTTGTADCQSVADLTVLVSNAPTVRISPDTVLCPGSGPLQLRADPPGGTWSGPGVTAGGLLTPAAPGSSALLTYTARNAACAGTATRRVSTAALPALVPTWAPVRCPENREAPLTVRFSGPADVRWDFGDGSSGSGATVEHTYPAGSFQPRALLSFNGQACLVTSSLPTIEVKPVFVPNVITPNGDGKNDAFVISPGCPARLRVFSRWGSQVFESASYHGEWTASGLPSGTYYYLLEYSDGPRRKGWVEVVK